MTNLDSNRTNMTRTTNSFCDNNPSPTSAITAFSTALASSRNKIILIDGLDQIALGSSGGVTLDTNALRKAMTDISFKCGSALTAYASSIRDNTLKAKVNYTESDYRKLKKDEVDDICQTVHDAADSLVIPAGPFGYDGNDVTDLAAAISLYRTAIQNPRQFIITRSNAKSQIKKLIREIIDNLFIDQMDKMVNTLKTAQPEFYRKYFLAREIIDLGSTTAKVRGTTTDNLTNTLNGVLFTIKKTGTTQVVGTTTSANGGKFSISNLLAGNYDFSWSLTGYLTQTETNIHISAGKELKRKIKMIPV